MTTVTADNPVIELEASAISNAPPGFAITDGPVQNGTIRRIPRPWGSGLFSPADIGAWLATRAQDFLSCLNNMLRIKGIDTRQEMIFQFNGLGNIVLVTDHPDRDPIELLVNSDRDLRQAFFAIASTSRFIDTLSARPDFEERYKLNPESAMIEYAPLAASLTRPTFNLQASRAGLTTYFTPKP